MDKEAAKELEKAKAISKQKLNEFMSKKELEWAISKIIRKQAKRFCGDAKVSLDNAAHVHTVANMSAQSIVEILDAGWKAHDWRRIEDGLPEVGGMYWVTVYYDGKPGIALCAYDPERPLSDLFPANAVAYMRVVKPEPFRENDQD
jgi:hypothetical protein